MNKLSDEEVMITVKNGRVEMLAIIFERHHVKLYNFLLRLTGSRTASEDLVQETFFRMLKYRHTYRGENKFTTWMFQISRNVHIDYLKKFSSDNSLDDEWHEAEADGATPDSYTETEQDLQLLESALMKLPLKKREILVLSKIQNMKYRDIASLLNCSIEAVKTNVHRAIKDLREIYSGLNGGVI